MSIRLNQMFSSQGGLQTTGCNMQSKLLVLTVLTLCYMVGEVTHFLTAVTSRELAQSIGFGDQQCSLNASYNQTGKDTNRDNMLSVLRLLQDTGGGGANLDLDAAAEDDGIPSNLDELAVSLENAQVNGEKFDGGEESLKALCQSLETKELCEDVYLCTWEYTGHGIEYQILMGPAYIVVFTVAGVIMGGLADRISRPILLSASSIIFSVSSMLMGLATQYWVLIILRMGVALGVSACRPAGGSLIAEVFTSEYRAIANAIFSWGVYLGYGISFLLGIYITDLNILGWGWRSAYFLSGVPGIIIAILLLFIEEPRNAVQQGPLTPRTISSPQSEKPPAPEISSPAPAGQPAPVRKLSCSNLEKIPVPSQPRKISYSSLEKSVGQEEDEEEAKRLNESGSYCRKIWSALSQPVMLCLFITASIRHTGSYAWTHNNVLYFHQYHQGMEIGYWFTICSILGGSVGVLTGGYISDSLVGRLGISSRLWLLSTATILSVPFSILTLYLDPPYAFGTLLAYYFLAETWFSLLFTVLVEIVPTSIRSVCIGIFLFLMNNIGGNLPMLIDLVRENIGLQNALYISWPGSIAVSGVLFFLSSLLLRRRSKT